jgi:CRP-like cAMP-binding protein
LQATNFNKKKQRAQIKLLVRNNVLVQNDFNVMKSIIKLISKSEKRNPLDIQHVTNILKNHEFFKKKRFNDDDLVEVASNFKYIFLKPGETLFTKGDSEEKMYILLKGEAMV